LISKLHYLVLISFYLQIINFL